jgi:transcriptional regulator with XRE-family HTH domain
MLRQQLGRISQDRLAEILSTNGDAIRNIENGRMKISAEIFRRIIDVLGLEYRIRSKQWFVVLSRNTLGDWRTVMAWRQSARPSAKQKRKDFDAIAYRLAALLAYAKPDEYNIVFSKISRSLEACLEEHPSKEAKDAFKRSRPEMHIIRASSPPKKKERLSKDEMDRFLSTLFAPVSDKEREEYSEEELGGYSEKNSGSYGDELTISEVFREYEDLPDPVELLLENGRADEAHAKSGSKKVSKPSS